LFLEDVIIAGITGYPHLDALVPAQNRQIIIPRPHVDIESAAFDIEDVSATRLIMKVL
jgi:hypothetical protein